MVSAAMILYRQISAGVFKDLTTAAGLLLASAFVPGTPGRVTSST